MEIVQSIREDGSESESLDSLPDSVQASSDPLKGRQKTSFGRALDLAKSLLRLLTEPFCILPGACDGGAGQGQGEDDSAWKCRLGVWTLRSSDSWAPGACRVVRCCKSRQKGFQEGTGGRPKS